MINASILALLIPIGILVVVPIVYILANHQRKMAELIHQPQQRQPDPEIMALRHEVRELKELIHQQAIAMDGRLSAPAERDNVRERLQG